MAVTKLLGPYLPIEGPPVSPAAHGLRDSARRIPDNGARWELGMNFYPETCATVLAWSPLCAVSGGEGPGAGADFDDPPVNAGLIVVDPYTLYVGFECEAVGLHAPPRDDALRVTRQLEAGTSKGMEHQFWADALATGGFSLQHSTPNDQGSARTGAPGVLNATGPVTPAAVGPLRALEMLGAAVGSCGLGAQSMFHVTPDLGEAWSVYLEKDGDRLRTKTRGDVVVIGAGYTGNGPVGNPSKAATDSLVWAYATGMVEYRLEEGVRFEATATADVMTRGQNFVTWYGQRNVAAEVDECCLFAVLVSLEGETT